MGDVNKNFIISKQNEFVKNKYYYFQVNLNQKINSE